MDANWETKLKLWGRRLLTCTNFWLLMLFLVLFYLAIFLNVQNLFTQGEATSSECAKWGMLVLSISATATLVLAGVPNIKMILSSEGKKGWAIANGIFTILLMLFQLAVIMSLGYGEISIAWANLFVGPFSVGCILIIDLMLAVYYQNADTAKRETMNVIFGLDIPILFGVLAIFFISKYGLDTLSDDNTEFIDGFVSGAVAMQVVIGNVSYGVSGIAQKLGLR